jgi:hypothetical protein
MIAMLLGHWIGDFVLQNNHIKPTKSKKFLVKFKKFMEHLLPHTLIYSIVLTVISILLMLLKIIIFKNIFWILLFFAVTYVTHIITDFLVSLVNMNYLSKNGRHKYFVSIGLDQFIHAVTILLSVLFILL